MRLCDYCRSEITSGRDKVCQSCMREQEHYDTMMERISRQDEWVDCLNYWDDQDNDYMYDQYKELICLKLEKEF